MKVKDLIELLQGYNPENEVVIEISSARSSLTMEKHVLYDIQEMDTISHSIGTGGRHLISIKLK